MLSAKNVIVWWTLIWGNYSPVGSASSLSLGEVCGPQSCLFEHLKHILFVLLIGTLVALSKKNLEAAFLLFLD